MPPTEFHGRSQEWQAFPEDAHAYATHRVRELRPERYRTTEALRPVRAGALSRYRGHSQAFRIFLQTQANGGVLGVQVEGRAATALAKLKPLPARSLCPVRWHFALARLP